MSNQTANRFVPDYAVIPGEILEEYIQSLGMKQSELAQRSGLTPKTINAIIKGKSPIVPETALKFEKILGRPAHFWNNLETQYRETVVRLKEKEQLIADQAWAQRFPYAEMAKRGWISSTSDKTEKVLNLLNFFGVASSAIWESLWTQQEGIAFRQSSRAGSFEAVTAWLRQGELEALKRNYPLYNEKKFRETLVEVRSLTSLPPDEFLPRLHALFESAGVLFVLVRELPKAGVFGATRWMNGRPLMQICLFSKSSDNFWFSIFHESAHILKHSRKEIFIGGNKIDSDKEREANEWARNYLIPQDKLKKFLATGKPTLQRIKIFSKEINIDAGIIVGRLQFDGALSYAIGNGLKTSYEWTDE